MVYETGRWVGLEIQVVMRSNTVVVAVVGESVIDRPNVPMDLGSQSMVDGVI
jgi:hypothetical protein